MSYKNQLLKQLTNGRYNRKLHSAAGKNSLKADNNVFVNKTYPAGDIDPEPINTPNHNINVEFDLDPDDDGCDSKDTEDPTLVDNDHFSNRADISSTAQTMIATERSISPTISPKT